MNLCPWTAFWRARFVQLGKSASRITDALQAWEPVRLDAAVGLQQDWDRVREAAQHMGASGSVQQGIARVQEDLSALMQEDKPRAAVPPATTESSLPPTVNPSATNKRERRQRKRPFGYLSLTTT